MVQAVSAGQHVERMFATVSSYGVFCFDRGGTILSWNPGVLEVLGYSREQFVGRTVDELFTEEDRREGAPAAEMSRAQHTGEAFDDRWHVRRDGSRVFVAGVVTPLRDERGDVCGFLKLIRDRTQFLETSKKLRERGDLAEAASREKDMFVAVVAHELRQPLNSILGWASMGAGGRLPSERSTEVFSRLARSAEAMVRFVNDLLDVSRIASGKLQLTFEPTDLSLLVRDAVFDAAPDARARHIALTTSLPAQCTVEGDAVRLRQVIVNLLGNAIKYTPPHGSVRIELDCTRTEAVLTVSDTGIGIGAEDLPQIFNRFRQSASADDGQSGLGLGLWLVKEIVERHRGAVSAESAGPGQGSVFAVRLPCGGADSSRAHDRG